MNDILALEDEGVIGLSRDAASYPGRTKIQLHRRDNHMSNSQIAHVKNICCRMSFRDHILSNGNFAILTTPCVLCVTDFRQYHIEIYNIGIATNSIKSVVHFVEIS